MALQIKRRVGGAAQAPSTLVVGQMAYNKPATGPDSLFVGDGTTVNTLISAGRQVELEGAQTINGVKTISIANLRLTGGANGEIIHTDGAGNLSFVAAPPATVYVDTDTALSGDGLVSDPITLTTATEGQVTTGTNDVYPITSKLLRDQTGADRLSLDTTAKTIVPAINEVYSIVTSLEGHVIMVGTYNAATDAVTPFASAAIQAGNLPAASSANQGWVVIATTGGTGTGHAPHVAISVGDWLVSDGTAWNLIDLDLSSVVASNVGITEIENLEASNVQDALEELAAGMGVHVDGVTITGDGTEGDPLVAELDDGTY